ncbi:MAG: ribonuclease [Cyanobacteriota bacterium]|jgi:ribonuclease HII
MNQSGFDSSLLTEYTTQDTLIAGVDEVGRGALFGSVVAAAVVLPLWAIPQLIALGVKDSKKLSPVKRQELIQPIKDLVAGWQISFATVAEIDELNILQASLLAMRRSILNLPVTPNICLIDGNFLVPNLNLAQKTVVKGDLRSPIIAAASILAKVWRDELITDLAAQYPAYDLARNKGYPTTKHRLAIAQQGITPEHRRSFKPCHLNLVNSEKSKLKP